VKYKATLPVLLLLLVAGQISAEFCRAQCAGMGMRMMEHACSMHGMAHAHCASCKHASAIGASGALSTLDACSGQICNSVLGLVQNPPDHGIKPSVSPVSIDILAPPVLEGTRTFHFRDARSTKFILPFDPLITSLRI
jgi:hypothetical protein